MFSRDEVADAYRLLLRRSGQVRRRRREEQRETIARLRIALAEVAPRFSVDRVYLYGSVLTDRWCPDSDLDLAVEGALSFGDLLKLWAELDGRLDREVDVRELTRLPFAEKVRAEGVIVYEREAPDAHG
ncbi:MAG: nucleotidyltransferase domain-containing protein [Firmicutes bacterium]|nr:nucleotidyltransferase domain-containing protein [Bacillota bacterium]